MTSFRGVATFPGIYKISQYHETNTIYHFGHYFMPCSTGAVQGHPETAAASSGQHFDWEGNLSLKISAL